MSTVYPLLTQLLLAQAEGGEAQGVQGFLQNPWMLPLLLFGVVYFMMIRPALKQGKEQQSLLGSLKKDDEVITQAGIIGKIHSIDERIVTLEVASGVRIKVLRTTIQGKFKADAPAAPAASPAKS